MQANASNVVRPRSFEQFISTEVAKKIEGKKDDAKSESEVIVIEEKKIEKIESLEEEEASLK